MSTATELRREAEACLHLRQLDTARSKFLEAAALENLNLTALKLEAEAALSEGDLEKATTNLMVVLEANPTDIDALLGATRAALFLGQLDDAAAYLDALLKMEPDNAKGNTFLGLLHESKGDLQAAFASLAKGADLGPEIFLCVYNIGRFLAHNGRYEPAVEALMKAVEIDPDHYEAYYALGIALTELGSPGDGIQAFAECVRIAPKQIDGYVTLVDVMLQVNDTAGAIEVLNTGMNECGEHPVLLNKAAEVSALAGHFANAVEYLELSTERFPDDKEAWLNIALLSVLSEELEKSEAAAKQVLAIDPEEWEAHYHLGNLYEVADLFEKAEASYREAVAFAPADEHRPHGNLGIALLAQDDKEKQQESLVHFERAVKLSPPGEWRFHYNRALAYAALGETTKARDLLKELSTQAPIASEVAMAAQALKDNLFSPKDFVRMKMTTGSLTPTGSFRPAGAAAAPGQGKANKEQPKQAPKPRMPSPTFRIPDPDKKKDN